MKPHSTVTAREVARVTELVKAITVEFGIPNASWSVGPQLWFNAHEWEGKITRIESVTWTLSVHPISGVCCQGYGKTADGAVTDLRAKVAAHMAAASGVAA